MLFYVIVMHEPSIYQKELLFAIIIGARPRGYKTYFHVNSPAHDISTAHRN